MKKSVFFFFVILFSVLIWLMWSKSNGLQKEVVLLKHQCDSLQTLNKQIENESQRMDATLYHIVEKYKIDTEEIADYYETQTE